MVLKIIQGKGERWALNPKQKKFCLEYVKTGNAKQAAIKAGYSEKTAYSIGNENLNKPELKNYIQELTDQMESQKIASAIEMQQVLTSIIRQETDEEVIVVEGCGEGMSEAVTKKKKPSHREVISAIDKLARMQGVMDGSKTNVNVFVPVFEGESKLED